MRRQATYLFFMAAAMLGLWLMFYAVLASVTKTPPVKPCADGKTRPERFRGHRIVCFYGDVVKVNN